MCTLVDRKIITIHLTIVNKILFKNLTLKNSNVPQNLLLVLKKLMERNDFLLSTEFLSSFQSSEKQ